MNDIKTLIANTYIDMVIKKNVDKITVKDLVSECHISRQSFYYHFQDLPDVVEWYLHNRFEYISKECEAANDLKEALKILVTNYMDQKDFQQKLLSSKYREQYERIGAGFVQLYLEGFIAKHKYNTVLSIKELEMAVMFTAYGLMGIIVEKGKSGLIDEEEFVEELYHLLSSSIKEFFKIRD